MKCAVCEFEATNDLGLCYNHAVQFKRECGEAAANLKAHPEDREAMRQAARVANNHLKLIFRHEMNEVGLTRGRIETLRRIGEPAPQAEQAPEQTAEGGILTGAYENDLSRDGSR